MSCRRKLRLMHLQGLDLIHNTHQLRAMMQDQRHRVMPAKQRLMKQGGKKERESGRKRGRRDEIHVSKSNQKMQPWLPLVLNLIVCAKLALKQMVMQWMTSPRI